MVSILTRYYLRCLRDSQRRTGRQDTQVSHNFLDETAEGAACVVLSFKSQATDRYSNESVAPVYAGEKYKGLDLLVRLFSNPHLWSSGVD